MSLSASFLRAHRVRGDDSTREIEWLEQRSEPRISFVSLFSTLR